MIIIIKLVEGQVKNNKQMISHGQDKPY